MFRTCMLFTELLPNVGAHTRRVEEMYGKMAASSETPAAVPVKPMYVSRGEQHVLGGYSGGEQYLVEGLY